MKRFAIVLVLTAVACAASLADFAPAAADDATCGKKGLPMCPLQDWMDKNMQSAFDAKDLKKLSEALKKSAGFVPDPKWNEGDKGWKKIAEDAAKAAEAGDFKAVQASCKTCHKTWRKQYRAEHRMRPVK